LVGGRNEAGATMPYIHCLFLVLLLADWAWDTHFGRNCLSTTMSSSQVTLAQSLGDGDLDQPLDQFTTWLICPAVVELASRLPEFTSALLAAAAPCRYAISLTYLFMSLQR